VPVFEEGLVTFLLELLLQKASFDHPAVGGLRGHRDAGEAGEGGGLPARRASGHSCHCDTCRSIQQTTATEAHEGSTPSYRKGVTIHQKIYTNQIFHKRHIP